jgi:hypothetical protein
MGGQRQKQQQQQHYRRYYPRLLIGLLFGLCALFVVIIISSFKINNLNDILSSSLSLSLFAAVGVSSSAGAITEEELHTQQRRHQTHHETQKYENENENKNQDNNVCVWSDEHGKEICGNSGDDNDSDSDSDNDSDAIKARRKKNVSSPYLPTSGDDDEDEDEDKNDDNDKDEEEEEDEYYYEEDDEEEEDEEYYGHTSSNYYGGGGRDYWDDDVYLNVFLEWPDIENGEEFNVWKHGNKNELYYELNCDKDEKDDDNDLNISNLKEYKGKHITNIHSKETWELFNKVYNKILKESNTKQIESSIPSQFNTNGYQYDIEIKFDPKVGRGVFALEDISKGSLLYVSINTATFYEGQIFRNFLFSLPKKLACDIMIWSYVREIKPEVDVVFNNADYENDYDDIYYPKFMICCDLDEGSFINSAYDENEYNMALGTKDDGTFYEDSTLEQKKNELWYGCKMHFYASTDIKKGDEIRADYSDFVEEDGWKYLGL